MYLKLNNFIFFISPNYKKNAIIGGLSFSAVWSLFMRSRSNRWAGEQLFKFSQIKNKEIHFRGHYFIWHF